MLLWYQVRSNLSGSLEDRLKVVCNCKFVSCEFRELFSDFIKDVLKFVSCIRANFKKNEGHQFHFLRDSSGRAGYFRFTAVGTL